AEAGRELGRFDSRPWLRPLPIPAAVVVTSDDRSVSPTKQRELAAALTAAVFEVAIDHLDVSDRSDVYNPALLDALDAVRARVGATLPGAAAVE
ncbi:MAG: alpha/beta fold hydrolase, partial [Solirubrobacteraceae bacterium]